MTDLAPPGASEPTAANAESGGSVATGGAPPASPAAAPATLGELSRRMADELARLDVEIEEVDLLVNQARTEAARHEARRVVAAEKLATTMSQAETSAQPLDAAVVTDLNAQLVTMTKRAALMESQVEVLEGKRRATGRYREAMAGYVEAMSGFDASTVLAAAPGAGGSGGGAGSAGAGVPPAVTRMLLDAQEDLRREIARQMHDGPAQSLTNIVLQAQIVERQVDPASPAAPEVRQLIGMVQQTLEATKSFIFDVRPMVLDDLGLMPTLRRSARERGGRSGVPIEFESLGADRRLSVDLESGLFRMVDEALAAYLTTRAERIAIRLDWSEQVEVTVSATRTAATVAPDTTPEESATKDLPPALAAMMEERRAAARDAVEAARRESIVVLPPSTWREIQDRAATLGITAELQGEGSILWLVAEAVPAGPSAA